MKTDGILFLKLRGKRGMFFIWAGFRRDMAGYLNYWGPNLPNTAEISQ